MNIDDYFQIFRFAMSDQANASVTREEERAAEDTAAENLQELREEYGENVDNSDDDVVLPPLKTEHVPNQSNEHVQKEPPKMNIQLQH